MEQLCELIKPGLAKNVEKSPQIFTQDPEFDAIAGNVLSRMIAGDSKVLKWNDQIKTLVGLYDQGTQGANATVPRAD